MPGRALAVIGAIAVGGGGAAIGYAVTRQAVGGMSPAQDAAMIRVVGDLDGAIIEARGTLDGRAKTLSALPAVRAAVETDAATVADQVRRGELQFAPGEGEILELDQQVKGEPKIQELMIQPAGAMHVPHHGMPGSYVELVEGKLVITAVIEVQPAYHPERLTGWLSATRPLPLEPVLKPVLDAGITGKLVIGAASVPIGAMPADWATHEHPLSSQSGAKLVVAHPPKRSALPLPVLIGGIAAALIGIALLIRAAVAARIAAGSLDGASAPGAGLTPSPLGVAQTQLSQVQVASGTPAVLPGMSPGAALDASGSQIVPGNLGPGAMIGRWEIVRRLGSGGMADVYLAQARGDGGFEKLVAIKVMHGHLARSQRAVDHFLDEARLAARIHHPNVVQIQDLGKIGNDYVIVMEYVEGVDLERLLLSARAGQRPVPIAVGLGILCRICDGLDAAHRATAPDGSPLGIIHRDVKSANVLVSRQGSVKLVDFGIAKAAKQVHFTFAGETKGTPAMMAPEQRVGDLVDVRADVYSVAAVGYELVTGQSVNLDVAALAHLGVDNWPHLPLPSTVRPGIPPEFDGILLGAMSYDRERRPADCATLGALCEVVMRDHNLVTSDKDIARWIESELRLLIPAYTGSTSNLVKSPSV